MNAFAIPDGVVIIVGKDKNIIALIFGKIIVIYNCSGFKRFFAVFKNSLGGLFTNVTKSLFVGRNVFSYFHVKYLFLIRIYVKKIPVRAGGEIIIFT